MSDASPRARRLATPSWLDTRLVLGVVLVLLAVVAGARVFAAADRFSEVFIARSALVPGEHLSAADLGVRQVRFSGEAGEYVGAGSEPIGYVVTRYVGAGELLPVAAISATAQAIDASRQVTVPVQPGHLPPDLGHGDVVDVYLSAKPVAGDRTANPVRLLAGVAVDATDDGESSLSGGSTLSVVLDVPADQVAPVVHAVESGTIDLVEVPPDPLGPPP